MTIAHQPAMPVAHTTTRRPQPRLAAAAALHSRHRVLSPVPQARTGAVIARITGLVFATTVCAGIAVTAALVVLSGVVSQLGS